jgi:hypothetical protein
MSYRLAMEDACHVSIALVVYAVLYVWITEY